MRRRLPLFVAVLWLAAAGWYWWREVPLRPRAVFRPAPGEFLEGLSPAGELMISRTTGAKTAGNALIRHGPLECRDPFDPGKRRIIFEPGDTIMASSHDREGRTVIVRDGVAWLASLATGEALEQLPGLPIEPGAHFWLKGDRLVYTTGGDVIVYDLSAKRTVSSLNGTPQIQWVLSGYADRYVTVWANDRRPTAPAIADKRIIDVISGEADTRFAALSGTGSLLLSNDGRYVIVLLVSKLTVYERETAAELWSAAVPFKRHLEIRFEDGDSTLVIDGVDAKDQRYAMHWRLSDGQLETESTVRTAKNASREHFEGTPYAVETSMTIRPLWEQVIVHGRNQIDFWISCTWGTRGDAVHRSTLVDTRTGANLGLLAMEWTSAWPLPDGRGFMIWSDNPPAPETARFFSLPPARDWGWLFLYGLTPAIVILAVARRFGPRRTRFVSQHGSASPLEDDSK
jgi:hypothetical protein